MNILPRLLFLFQMIPFQIPAEYFTRITTMICRYVWGRRRPRLTRSLLTRSKAEGGLALPDIKQYFLAVILSRISDWKYHKDSKLWMSLEVALGGSDLYPLIWIPKKTRHLSGDASPLTCYTLRVWDLLCKRHAWQCNSPLMPITGHMYFPPGTLTPDYTPGTLGTQSYYIKSLKTLTFCLYPSSQRFRTHRLWINGDICNYQISLKPSLSHCAMCLT